MLLVVPPIGSATTLTNPQISKSMFDTDVNLEFYHVENTGMGNENIDGNRLCMWIVRETLCDISLSHRVLIRIPVFWNTTPFILVHTYNGKTAGSIQRLVHY